jgi:hypothetical protein
MTTEEFEKILDEIQRRERGVLVTKSGDYAREGDRLSSFKKAAALETCTPERALYGMMAKHLVSVADLVNDLDRGKNVPMAVWEEKIGDSRNYLALLECLLRERGSVSDLGGERTPQ